MTQSLRFETRTIELVNFAPVLVVDFEPALNPWSELIMPQTGTVTINTTGTYDPEGDDFACIITFSGYNRQGPAGATHGFVLKPCPTPSTTSTTTLQRRSPSRYKPGTL